MGKVTLNKTFAVVVWASACGSVVKAQNDATDVDLSTMSLAMADLMSAPEFVGADGLLDEVPLYLSAVINGRDTGMVAEFTLHRAGRRMSASWAELDQIGIVPPKGLGAAIYLDQIVGLTYTYDAASQAIDLRVPLTALKPRRLNERQGADYVAPQAGYGAVLNYRLTTNLGNDIFNEGAAVKSAFADLEARVYTPLGVLVTTGAASASNLAFKDAQLTRYDSSFTYSNPNHMVTVTAGDFVTSTLPWARPVRLGGVQIRRDFGLRTDVVTSPSLSYTGMAAVPSSVDVYVDNIRAWSGKTDAGPFKLSDLPYITSAGEAVVVMRDAAGNESTERLPFFAGHDVLKAGTFDYTFDLGQVRNPYGNDGSDYGDDSVGTASLRYGLTDAVTLLGHGEGGLGLTAGSLGVSAVLFHRAEATVALGQSRLGDETGHMTYATLRTKIAGADVRLTHRHSDETFADLAYVTGAARLAPDAGPEDFASLRPATASDTVTINLDNWVRAGSLGLNYIHAERQGQKNEIISAAYSRRLWQDGPSFRAGGFTDLAEGGYGVSLGLSMTLGKQTYAGLGLSRGRTGNVSSYASLSQPVGRELGSYGYRINFNDWHSGDGQADLAAAYRTGMGLGEVRLTQNDGNQVAGSASFEGALVLAGGTLLAGNKIEDGFAVVNVGIPWVPVELYGRNVARTGIFGAALVPDLQAYRNNRVSIDPKSLPLDANVSATAMTVVPSHKSGVTVNFGAGDTASALLTVTGPDGAFLPAGTLVKRSGARDEFTVGYDGELWLDGLKSHNTLTAMLDKGRCTATFSYAKAGEDVVHIDGVQCK